MSHKIFTQRVKANVFTLRRAYSNGFYTIRVDNDKPSILAFRSKSAAERFVSIEKQMHGPKRQPIAVEQTPLHGLWRRCSNNMIDLVVFDDAGSYEVLDITPKSVDDVAFYLENVIRYM